VRTALLDATELERFGLATDELVGGPDVEQQRHEVALATLLRRVRFDVLEDPGLAMQLLLQPDGDVPARVAKR
jgi:hypothetical protein